MGAVSSPSVAIICNVVKSCTRTFGFKRRTWFFTALLVHPGTKNRFQILKKTKTRLNHTHTHPSGLLHHQVGDLLVEMQLTFASIKGDVGPEGAEVVLELETRTHWSQTHKDNNNYTQSSSVGSTTGKQTRDRNSTNTLGLFTLASLALVQLVDVYIICYTLARLSYWYLLIC